LLFATLFDENAARQAFLNFNKFSPARALPQCRRSGQRYPRP
jgi:hypothetical protein